MKVTELLPITEKNASLTMSSREIAELTHKEHKNVLRVIRDLIEQNLVAQIEPLKFEYRNQWFDYYELNKRDFCCCRSLTFGSRFGRAKTGVVARESAAINPDYLDGKLFPQWNYCTAICERLEWREFSEN